VLEILPSALQEVEVPALLLVKTKDAMCNHGYAEPLAALNGGRAYDSAMEREF
jgi:hypothetical protein